MAGLPVGVLFKYFSLKSWRLIFSLLHIFNPSSTFSTNNIREEVVCKLAAYGETAATAAQREHDASMSAIVGRCICSRAILDNAAIARRNHEFVQLHRR